MTMKAKNDGSERAFLRMRRTKSALIIAAMTTAACGFGTNLADAEDIALSLVHPKGRIDVPVGAVDEIDTAATIGVRNAETGAVTEHAFPHVAICLAPEVRERICQLTQKIVEEPLAIVVDCETISKPIVREPLCNQPCFHISVFDLDDATALAQRIRRGTNRACAPSS